MNELKIWKNAEHVYYNIGQDVIVSLCGFVEKPIFGEEIEVQSILGGMQKYLYLGLLYSEKKRFLIAGNHKDGVTSAKFDFCWHQIGQSEFIDNEGVVVKVISDCQKIQGYSPFQYYIGYRSYAARNIEIIRYLTDTNRAERLGEL